MASSNNATVSIPSSSAGTTSPVVVTVTRVDQALGASVALTITDVAGNVTNCDPVVTTLTGQASRDGWQVYSGLAQADSQVRISNGDPGLRAVLLLVNGKAVIAHRLTSNETRTVSIARAMLPGSTNKVIVRGVGTAGSSADVLIWDGTGSAAVAAPKQATLHVGNANSTSRADQLLQWLTGITGP